MKMRTLLSILLVLVIALTVPAQALAEAKPTAYLSDVMVGMGNTADEAKKALTDAGYTVLDQNVNEGAGSKLKTDKYVYIGYKTTENYLDAITDLAVMNMNGGYSFSDYAALMDKYRDSQIKPFVDSFLAAIKEYRANYKSENDANKAKADYAYTVLSRIFNEDCGNNMAELLLNPTKEEKGLTDDQYKALSDEEKKTTVDLTTTLMQGNTQVVLLVEQMLAMAADTNETTWLQRLSELGPEGLEQKYAEKGIRPAEYKKEMASLYDDTAKKLLEGWEDMRTSLLDYDAQNAAEGEDAQAAEVDPEDITVHIGVGDVEPNDVNIANPGDMVGMIKSNLEASAEIAEEAEETRDFALYAALKATPYGDGTMYDFFTKPYAEVSGENISALYPMVSTLTEGQIAAIDFLSLALLLQIGVTDCESYMQCGLENSDLLEVVENAAQVSMFVDVNREIFGSTTALTSEALREQTLSEKSWTDPDSDLLGLSRLTALSWAATGASLLTTLAATCKYKYSWNIAQKLLLQNEDILANFSQKTIFSAYGLDFSGIELDRFDLDEADIASDLIDFTKLNVSRTKTGIKVSYSFNMKNFVENSRVADLMRDFDVDDPIIMPDFKNCEYFADKPDELKLAIERANKRVEEIANEVTNNNGLRSVLLDYEANANQSVDLDIGKSAAKKLKLDEIDDCAALKTQIDQKQFEYAKNADKWGKFKKVSMVITALLAIGSIGLSVYDLYRYYNVKYTPIPQYIVDEADITYLDADGNKLVTRNDTAYYSVVKTNRPESHENYESLHDYADLNGDVGQQWLALYTVKHSGGEPILADSLKVVTGSTKLPDGYEKGVHMFGSNAAMNLTDSRYTYNDNLNGIYLYFKTEAASASTDTASVFSGGALALVGVGGAVVGAAIGALVTVLIKRKKKSQEAE